MWLGFWGSFSHIFCSTCTCTAFHLLLLGHSVWQGLQEMFFTDNSPLLHWIFSFITYQWVSSENSANPLPPFALYLHPISPSFTHFPEQLWTCWTAQTQHSPASRRALLLTSAPCLSCYLCFLWLNQVIIQTGRVVFMQPQSNFHKSLWSRTLLKVIRKVDSICPVHVLVLPFKYFQWELENW